MLEQRADARGAPQEHTLAGLPIDPQSLFPAKDGFFARRARKRRTLVLERLREVLQKALAPGEVIRFATTGYRYSGWEFYFAGVAAYRHNQVALVLTDRRLLLLQIHGKRPGALKNHLPLEAIRRVTGSFGRVKLELGDGKKLVIIRSPRVDAKCVRALVPGDPGAACPAPALEALCPACLTPVPGPVGATLTCPSQTCRIPFRDPARAARFSAFVPGLGDLYLGHHLFGSLEFLGSMLMLGMGAAMVASGEPAAVFALVMLIAVPRVIDYPLTRYMGRKGLAPLALQPAPGAQARNLPSFPAWAYVLFAAGIALAGGVAWALLGVPESGL